jgi:hypothetical protein
MGSVHGIETFGIVPSNALAKGKLVIKKLLDVFAKI